MAGDKVLAQALHTEIKTVVTKLKARFNEVQYPNDRDQITADGVKASEKLLSRLDDLNTALTTRITNMQDSA